MTTLDTLDLLSPAALARLSERRAAPLLPRLPAAAAIDAALEELVEIASRGLETAEHAADRTFYRRQRNAFVNAQADRSEGRLARAVTGAFLVPSSRSSSTFYRVELVGATWCCSCPAGEVGGFCRHAAQITAVDVGAMIEESQAADHVDDLVDEDLASLLREADRSRPSRDHVYLF